MRYAFIFLILGFAPFLHAASENNSAWPKSGEGIKKAMALYAPKPPYPYEARLRGFVGFGVVVLEIDIRTGYVKSARMQPSTGHKILDEAALGAFRQWRFKPGTVSKAKIPIRYSMKGSNL